MEFLTLAPSSDRILVELFQILKDGVVESAALNMQYPLRGLEGVPGLPGAPQDEAGLTRKFEIKCLHTDTEIKHHTRANKFQGKTYQAHSPATKERSPELHLKGVKPPVVFG